MSRLRSTAVAAIVWKPPRRAFAEVRCFFDNLILAIPMSEAITPRTPANAPDRLPWEAPEVAQLPRLTELTLATGGGIPGGGGTGGGGSTVIP
jgi:hypothetical protein